VRSKIIFDLSNPMNPLLCAEAMARCNKITARHNEQAHYLEVRILLGLEEI
jgi:hypothetical protein